MRAANMKEENLADFIGNDIHKQRLVFKQSISLSKELAWPYVAENRPVPPGIIALDGHASLQNQAEPLCDIPSVHENIAFFKLPFLRMKEGESLGNLIFRHAFE